jgi:hypothetical protein
MAGVVMSKVLQIGDWFGEVWLTPVKDLIMSAVYVASLLGNTVLWEGRRFKVTGGCAMQEER